ncbi:MAG: tRNA (adenosine(37)-N6)-threonylcarbamoyltransferase complex dimerization subunit type 1 TsaB [Bacteroidia bacterium]
MEPLILNIETATFNGSVALSKGDEILAFEHLFEGEKHIKTLAVATQNLCGKVGIDLSEINAVAISSGPGSYTGLRIGLSFAKGISLATNCKLINVPTLEILRNAIFKHHHCELAVPLLDARRMEVYTAAYTATGQIFETTPLVIDEKSFLDFTDKKVVFAGNGAEKCAQILKHKNWVFDQKIKLNAIDMAKTAIEKYKASAFENLATFEPFYLKEFSIGASTRIAQILNS